MKKKREFKKTMALVAAMSMFVMITGCAEGSSKVSSTTESAINNGISSFEDINTDKVKLVAIGNSDVPVGQYSQEILTSMGFWDDIQSKISFGTNVKEVLSQVASGSVDCGIVYATDASSDDDVTVICTAPEDSMQTPVVYPAAMLKESENKEAAEAFIDFLLSQEAITEFENTGFKMKSDTLSENKTYDRKCTLTVFAAASLTESLTTIGTLFNERCPEVEIVFNFDSSGTLKTQIESGAEVDVFISAAQKQMNGLSDEGYIADETKIDLLENEVVLIVPKD